MCTMNGQGAKWEVVAGVNNTCLITAEFCRSLERDCSSTDCLQWKNYTVSPSVWVSKQLVCNTLVAINWYVKEIIISCMSSQQYMLEEDRPNVVIMGKFNEQTTSSINDPLEEHEIHVCLYCLEITQICSNPWIFLPITLWKNFWRGSPKCGTQIRFLHIYRESMLKKWS